MKSIYRLTLAGFFLAAGLILPFLTGQIQVIGSMLCPMHLPVLLCGLVCGWKYGLCVGFILPLLRNLLFGMPPFYPQAISMAFELAAYGLLVGLLYDRQKNQSVGAVFTALILAMLGGRIVWGLVMWLLTFGTQGAFTIPMFIAGAFTNALPGIALMLLLIPLIMGVLNQTGVLRFRRTGSAADTLHPAARENGSA